LNEKFRRRCTACITLCFAILVTSALLGGCATDSVTSDAAKAMSTPGIGPDKFAPLVHGDILGAGDQLQLTVIGYPEFNTTASIKASGVLTIPLIGDVKAVGLTRDQLEAEIVRRLSDYVKSKVYITLNLMSATVQNIIVLGAVGAQGSFPNTAPVSVFQLLATAGGPTGEADLRHIKLYRNSDLSREEEIDLSGIVSPGTHTSRGTPMVTPGDLVYVPKTENFIRQFSPFVYDILVVLTLFSLVK
jgi:polysaccharide biosynthesis/export protein